jgi:hypothetical protein
MKRASGRIRDLRSACILGDSTGDEDADRILAALRGAPEGLIRSEIRRDVFGDHKPAETIASKLALLLRLGLVRSQSETETGGRPAERWFSSAPCVKSGIGVKSRPDTAPDPLDALATEAAAESRPAGAPAEGTSLSPAVAGPPVPAEWQGAPLDGRWRPVIDRLPVPWRHRWEARSKVHQAAGLPRDLAELRAYREVVEEIAAG